MITCLNQDFKISGRGWIIRDRVAEGRLLKNQITNWISSQEEKLWSATSFIFPQENSNGPHSSQHIHIFSGVFGGSCSTVLQFQAMSYLGMPDWPKRIRAKYFFSWVDFDKKACRYQWNFPSKLFLPRGLRANDMMLGFSSQICHWPVLWSSLVPTFFSSHPDVCLNCGCVKGEIILFHVFLLIKHWFWLPVLLCFWERKL